MGVTRKQRLEDLLDLAQTYRGWTRKQLARALGRDTTKLVPASGLPKLDIVMDLARVLDWSVEDVAQHLWGDDAHRNTHEDPDDTANGLDFEAAQRQSLIAHREGRYQDALDLARRAQRAAENGDQYAIASNREAAACDGLGRYAQTLATCRRGLSCAGVSPKRRLLLESNLATAYYSLWHLTEARGTAQLLIDRFAETPPQTRVEHVVLAHAHYVRGHAYRRLIALEPESSGVCAARARDDLECAERHFTSLAAAYEEDAYGGVANTCRGGLLEVDVVLGRKTARDALRAFGDGLGALVDPATCDHGDWLESYGWWCILGCNVALRHLTDERELQSHMAIFTNKADEIAEQLDNWALRERVFTLEYARRQRFADWTGVESDWTIDREDVRIIAGTMGRFPGFHRTGWRILQSANLVTES